MMITKYNKLFRTQLLSIYLVHPITTNKSGLPTFTLWVPYDLLKRENGEINHILNVTYLDALGQYVADMDSNGMINILDIIQIISIILEN